MKTSPQNTIGWKEWLNLECLGLPAIKGKVDTGAKTSALHAFNVESFFIKNVEYVRFNIHPLQKNKELEQVCVAKVIDRRMISDSSGKKERRFVIESDLSIGDLKKKIEITLVNRDSMTFRMLLGRDAVKQFGMLVDPAKSFLQGKIKKSKAAMLYRNRETPNLK
jgi:hypothetical protein